ncbi:MAG: stage III sporulation protein AD [Oscillospiraceae bacterium]|nr:stage III sporulation protein AD [Oscillospiraceae bacterium]
MEELMRIATLAVLGLAMTLLLKRDVPPLALIVTIALIIAILMMAINTLGQVNAFIMRAAEVAELNGDILVPLMKTVAIAVIVRVFASLCRDACETAIAAAVEIAGAAIALVLLLPLFNAVLELTVHLL